MSISATLLGRSVVGNECMTWGTYTDSGAATEGNVNTYLGVCTKMILQPYGTTVATNAGVINETFPVDGSAVTIRVDASQVGLWLAWGDRFL